jgi:hypothetical protein
MSSGVCYRILQTSLKETGFQAVTTADSSAAERDKLLIKTKTNIKMMIIVMKTSEEMKV